MKLLIVDDEKHVITTIRCLIPAKQLGITEILSAQTAAEAKILLEKERPEIAIVDIILHNQTGMNLLAFIVNRRLPTQVIAISGHADYEYVRTMLLNGAVDYLLKPVESKALVASLEKAIRRLAPPSATASEHEATMNMSLSLQYIRTQLRKMLVPTQAESAYSELSSLDDQFAVARCCTLLYYDTHYLPMRSALFRTRLNQFEEKTRSYLSLHRCGQFLDKFNSQHEHLLMLLDDTGEHLHQIEAIAGSIFSSTAFAFHMGCVTDAAFPESFADGFEKTRACFFGDDCYVAPELLQKETVTTAFSFEQSCGPEGLERHLLSLIVVQDTQGLLEEAERWLGSALATDFVPLGRIRALIYCYNAMTVRWSARLKEFFPSFAYDSTAERVSYMDFLDEYYTFSAQMMMAVISRSLRLFAARVSQLCTDTDVFKLIAFYMELNYDQAFNQAEYAKMFHLNRDYLSRKFKQIFGEGMVSYLNRLRITHAEQLMRDPSLKIRTIAYMTGYSDEKYFTRQFKEFTHVTPSEYRAMLQVEETEHAR